MNAPQLCFRRFFLGVISSSLLFLCGFSALAESRLDHLVPVDEQRERGEPFATYNKAIERNLFLTSGDIARVVRLPGTIGVETVVSVYSVQQAGDLDYRITVTQPSKSLWNPEGARRSVNIRRLDAPLPASTALMVQKAWAAMLHSMRESHGSDDLVEASAQIFSIKEGEKRLRGQAEGIPRGRVARLSRIADLLTGYCEHSPSRRKDLAIQIERECARLLDHR